MLWQMNVNDNLCPTWYSFQRRQSGLKSGGRGSGLKKMIFSGNFRNKKVDFFKANFQKISTFSGNFTKKRRFFKANFRKLLIFKENFLKFSIFFRQFNKKIRFSRQKLAIYSYFWAN